MRQFVIEVLGIDGMGLRLMRDVFVRPRRVFEDFLDDSYKTYAPPLRVWLWVYGVQVLLLVIGGGAGAFIERISNAQSGQNVTDLLTKVGVDADRFFALTTDWWTFINPVLMLAFSIPAAAVLGWFRRGIPFAQHANVYLSCFLAASLVTLIARPLFTEYAPAFAGLLGLISAFVFALTFVRGAPAAPYFTTVWGAFAKTVLIALVFFLTTVAAAVVLMVTFAVLAHSGS